MTVLKATETAVKVYTKTDEGNRGETVMACVSVHEYKKRISPSRMGIQPREITEIYYVPTALISCVPFHSHCGS